MCLSPFQTRPGLKVSIMPKDNRCAVKPTNGSISCVPVRIVGSVDVMTPGEAELRQTFRSHHYHDNYSNDLKLSPPERVANALDLD